MKIIVDTNVPIVANAHRSPQASPTCVISCVKKLQKVQTEQVLVLDDGWYILREYMNNLRSEGQPGIGDAFLKWVLTNRTNPKRCSLVHITPKKDGHGNIRFDEFPNDQALAGFDSSDHKFVAVALADADHPPIVNAVDTDWRDYRSVLEKYGVHIEFLCPEAMQDG